MFRFNNPDALLVMLLVASAYCLTRALEAGRHALGRRRGHADRVRVPGQDDAGVPRPAGVRARLPASRRPTALRRRLVQLLAGAAAIVISAGWWVAIVALLPASSRPMIDGSPDNSILDLITGYNGLGRIFGGSGPGGGGGGANFSGSTGLLRLFNDLMGGQASWLLPGGAARARLGLWQTRRAPRTDRHPRRAAALGRLADRHGARVQLSSGVIHTYYTVALAPAIAALVGIAGSLLWHRRDLLTSRITMAVAVALSAGWSWVLLDRTPQWEGWLRTAIVLSALAAVVGLLAMPALRGLGRWVTALVAALALAASLSGSLAYAAQTSGPLTPGRSSRRAPRAPPWAEGSAAARLALPWVAGPRGQRVARLPRSADRAPPPRCARSCRACLPARAREGRVAWRPDRVVLPPRAGRRCSETPGPGAPWVPVAAALPPR